MTSSATAASGASHGTAQADTTSRLGRERAAPLLVVLGCLALVLALALTLVETVWGQRLDVRAMGAIDADWRTRARLVDGLDLLTPATPAELALVMLGLGALALARRRVLDALGVALIIGAANVAGQLVKLLLPRPAYGFGSMNTFPSGHVTAVTSLALALVLVAPAAYRTATVFAGGLMTSLVAVATVSAGWHRPSDAIAAIALTLAVGAAVLAAAAAFEGHQPQPQSAVPDRQRGRPAYGVGSWLVRLSAAPVAAGVLLLVGLRTPAGHSAAVSELLILAIGVCSAAAVSVFSALVNAETFGFEAARLRRQPGQRAQFGSRGGGDALG